jgi:hypothetical protein
MPRSKGEFNPLSLESLAESVVTALMRQPVQVLSQVKSFKGSGIYALYLVNPTGPYGPLARYNDEATGRLDWPIYVGKAVPKGARKGGADFGAGSGSAIYSRLKQHAKSIDQVPSLRVEDFRCRFLVTAPVWIKLAENVVIREYRPVWNAVVDGFGNHDPGIRRAPQHRSKWDTLHAGRSWAAKLGQSPLSATQVEHEVREFLTQNAPPSAGETSRRPPGA